MEHSHNQLIPYSTVDVFYNQIKLCIEEDRGYDHYIRNLLKINAGEIPEKI